MSEEKSELKTKLKEKIQKLQEKAQLVNTLNEGVDGLKMDVGKHSELLESLKNENSMAAELLDKAFKENSLILSEQENIKTEMGNVGTVLDKILELITEYQIAEEEGSEEGEEGNEEMEESAEKTDTTPEPTAEPAAEPAKEAAEGEESETEGVSLEGAMKKLTEEEQAIIKAALETTGSNKPKPPVQMESGLKDTTTEDDKKNLKESVVKIASEKSLSGLF